jgi:D-serine dehydratase
MSQPTEYSDADSPQASLVLNASATQQAALRERRPLLWCNPDLRDGTPVEAHVDGRSIGLVDVRAARERFARFSPLLASIFPELRASADAIESPLSAAPRLQAGLGLPPEHGALWIKADHLLPVAGSIKARGGFHEVLEHAERVARREGLWDPAGSPNDLATDAARAVFARHTVAVGSTGNLGLAIGVMSAALGFRAVVHMSADAKAWKKTRLRQRGVEVVEHEGDYAEACAAGRREAASDPRAHFVDDERSLSLLLGYASAVPHLRQQLEAARRPVDAEHPLFVYLPCGVGGAPAGITFGLKLLFGPSVHCFFVEPVASPCFLLGMIAPPGKVLPVYALGLDNRTEADGLAVPRASEPALEVMRPLLSGAGTVRDEMLFDHLRLALSTENQRVEPSAAAGLSGPALLLGSDAGREYLERHRLQARLSRSTHLAWTTGGLFVPEDEYQAFLALRAADRPD